MLVVLFLILGASVIPAAGQGLYGRNLVVNGDAEAGPGMPDPQQKANPITGWTTNGSFTVVQYSANSISPSDDGRADRGKNYFIGGGSASPTGYIIDATGNGIGPGERVRACCEEPAS